jgi:hypothetical protein
VPEEAVRNILAILVFLVFMGWALHGVIAEDRQREGPRPVPPAAARLARKLRHLSRPATASVRSLGRAA